MSNHDFNDGFFVCAISNLLLTIAVVAMCYLLPSTRFPLALDLTVKIVIQSIALLAMAIVYRWADRRGQHHRGDR